MSSLYNAVENSGELLITKFDSDYRPEARYVVSQHGCDCPAGSRPTCRHRKMREMFLRDAHIGDGWFLDWDTRLWWRPASGDVADAIAEQSLADREDLLPAGVESQKSSSPSPHSEPAATPASPSPAAVPTALPPSVPVEVPCPPPAGGGIRRRIGT